MKMKYKIMHEDIEIAEKLSMDINKNLSITYYNCLIYGFMFSGTSFILSRNLIVSLLFGIVVFLANLYIFEKRVYKRLARIKYKYHKDYYEQDHTFSFSEEHLMLETNGETIKIKVNDCLKSYEDEARYIVFPTKNNYFIVNKTELDLKHEITNLFNNELLLQNR
ncbi:hypothetical protein [Marinilactibacillus kalidii]|uniref:hypothetical protein n=1 Tax=Marinilactibacillus kalidii TaxID=2820274 RepID=UPI001ABE041B|nr:hypothetical protein [Marinilactibacillus kalidii]